MRRAVIAALIVLFAIDTADACHRFSRWYYPWRQSCRVTALAPHARLRFPHTRVNVDLRPTFDIPLPSLTDIDWGHAPDDEMRGKILLRVIMQGKEAK